MIQLSNNPATPPTKIPSAAHACYTDAPDTASVEAGSCALRLTTSGTAGGVLRVIVSAQGGSPPSPPSAPPSPPALPPGAPCTYDALTPRSPPPPPLFWGGHYSPSYPLAGACTPPSEGGDASGGDMPALNARARAGKGANMTVAQCQRACDDANALAGGACNAFARSNSDTYGAIGLCVFKHNDDLAQLEPLEPGSNWDCGGEFSYYWRSANGFYHTAPSWELPAVPPSPPLLPSCEAPPPNLPPSPLAPLPATLVCIPPPNGVLAPLRHTAPAAVLLTVWYPQSLTVIVDDPLLQPIAGLLVGPACIAQRWQTSAIRCY